MTDERTAEELIEQMLIICDAGNQNSIAWGNVLRTMRDKLRAREEEQKERDTANFIRGVAVGEEEGKDLLQAYTALRERVEKVCGEMRATLFNEPGTPMWIRAQVCDWAGQLRGGK